ncbi:MAG: mannose-1-phosphate guanylyltransferase [Spirochaetaceae bacterium]|nr:mannose-1-phosphate guanylyltransferase [Spirochaetaceae bacterium]
MKETALILAGGKGERFWPKSKKTLPKQFLSFTEDARTMIQLTVKRLAQIINYEDISIITNRDYVELVKRQLPQIPRENILVEPVSKNTASAIGFGAEIIKHRYGDAIMMVLASDHLIKDEKSYLKTMRTAAKVAEDGENLVTIGITPTYPETGYGYIKFSKYEICNYPGVHTVKAFREKPDQQTAEEYFSSGQYLWNSGMFVWKISSVLKKFAEYLPDTYAGLEKIGSAIGKTDFERVLHDEFRAFKNESIDYGIMEKAEHIYAVPGNFGWDDMGNWLAMERINNINEDNNTVAGDVITIGTRDSIIIGGKRLVATVGLENMIVVDSDDAVLICKKEKSQEIKKVIENLKICNRQDLL